jgi:GntR family transcriptional repressor for pyruvate dehydrogenase complex
MFTKVEHTRVKDAVVRQFEALILEGVLRPGDQIPVERELARLLDVSRPKLREALIELERRELLVARQGGGTYVANVFGSVFAQPIASLFESHRKALGDYLEFRREVEPIAAGLAAERATDADQQILTRVFARMEAAHARADSTQEASLDVDLHNAIVDASHNIVLIQTLRSIYELLVQGVFYNRAVVYAYPGARDALLDQHRAMYDAVMGGDATLARSAARAHMTYVEGMMKKLEAHLEREQTSQRRLDTMSRRDDQRGRRAGRGA